MMLTTRCLLFDCLLRLKKALALKMCILGNLFVCFVLILHLKTGNKTHFMLMSLCIKLCLISLLLTNCTFIGVDVPHRVFCFVLF